VLNRCFQGYKTVFFEVPKDYLASISRFQLGGLYFEFFLFWKPLIVGKKIIDKGFKDIRQGV